MKTKIIPCPERLRRVPRQFSWIDHRLVREGHIKGHSPGALALYLFLCTVADGQGLSYYSGERIGELLGFGGADLRAARAELEASGLVAYSRPFYQVLSLEPEVFALPPSPLENRSGQAGSVAEILHMMMEVKP